MVAVSEWVGTRSLQPLKVYYEDNISVTLGIIKTELSPPYIALCLDQGPMMGKALGPALELFHRQALIWV